METGLVWSRGEGMRGVVGREESREVRGYIWLLLCARWPWWLGAGGRGGSRRCEWKRARPQSPVSGGGEGAALQFQ